MGSDSKTGTFSGNIEDFCLKEEHNKEQPAHESQQSNVTKTRGEKVSEPVLSHEGGWFRYNYEKGRLEFINQETKAVTFTRVIPEDQWEALPSQHDYCQKIVDQCKAQLASQAALNKKR